MENLNIENLMKSNAISTYSIKKTENESNYDFDIIKYLVEKNMIDNNLGVTVLIVDGEIKSSIALSNDDNQNLIIKLSNGIEIPFDGDLTRSAVANVLFSLADSPQVFEVANFLSDEIKNFAIDNIDLNFQEKALGNNDALVLNPEGIFDKDCSNCGGGPGKCGNYSQKCG